MTVGVALCGYGYWGVNLARNLVESPATDLAMIIDPVEGLRDRAAASHPAVTIAANLHEALADDRVEAVVIATPAALHEEMALSCLDAGRHVMVEKPLALTPEGAERIVRAGADAGRVVMVGHTFLYSAPVQRLREIVDDGELGRVQYLYSQRLSLGRIRRDCNALWNFAPHDLSIMLYLLQERPEEVSATGFRFIGEVEDVSFASLTFPSGIGANLHVSWIDPRKTRLMTVVGDQKMVIYNDVSVDQKLWVVDAGVARNADLGTYESMGEFQWRTRAGDIHIPRIAMQEPLLAEMTEFGEACRTGRPPRTDGAQGVDVVRVLTAIDESSARRGAPVKIEW